MLVKGAPDVIDVAWIKINIEIKQIVSSNIVDIIQAPCERMIYCFNT